MFILTDQHLQEISKISPLMTLVNGNIVSDGNMKQFVRLCVDHCCAQTFLHICKAGPLNVLAQHNGVALAKILDFSTEHPKAWKRAARHAGTEGHEEFAEYILGQCDSDEIRKSVVTGACMGDKVALVERFAPAIEDPGFASHLPPLAAQLNAVECLRFLVKGISSKNWMSAMMCAAVEGHQPLIDVLMDNIPVDVIPQEHWCHRVAARVVGTPGDQRILHWLFHYTTAYDVIHSFSRLSQDHQERLHAAYATHQSCVLNAAVDGTDGAPRQRKM